MPGVCIGKSALLCVEDAVEQGHEHPFVVHVEEKLIDAFEGAGAAARRVPLPALNRLRVSAMKIAAGTPLSETSPTAIPIRPLPRGMKS